MGSLKVGGGVAGEPMVDDWRHDPWDDPDVADALLVERPRGSRWPIRALVYSVLALAMALIIAAGGVGWWYLHEVNPSGDPGDPVTFTVNEGETIDSLSRRLLAEGFISNDGVFRWYAERQGELELTPGYYALRPFDHMGNLLSVLRTPPEQTFTSVTFPEGFTVEQMSQRLAEQVPRLDPASFLDSAARGAIRSEWLPTGTTTLEGLLFPDTYQVSNGESEVQVVQRMVDLMERVGRQERIVELGYVQQLSAYEVLIVASMVEREAKVSEDRPMIARVILNRLELGMPLQIDATLFYGQNPNLSFTTLKNLPSPYNTYLNLGLPPTPIANPGRASIAAVVNPAPDPPAGGAECQGLPKEQCRWLYYVLADEDGGHAFSVTLEQHEANIAVAREAGLL